MCGIAGFTRFDTRWGNEATLRRMGDSMSHRGPDASGEYLDEHIGLSHRRLSIVDLSAAGNQPMTTTDGQAVIVFNGEIYNFPELRADLVDRGVSFRSHSDTEVILALYQLEGIGLLEKINGMFAFALWDKTIETLFIARDRIGKKPLYYYLRGNDIAFASELKALYELDDIPRDIRLDAVYDFFAYQYIPDPKTVFEDLFKLEPGHYLKVSRDRIDNRPYWKLSYRQTENEVEAGAESELLRRIDASTRRRLISDVPLGAFLSGGVDSSGIVALMANASDNPVTTCTIGFDDARYNESEFAQTVADLYRTSHHRFTVHDNVRDNIDEIVAYFDEPFADPSLVPTYFVSRLARQKVTVALSGDGGDEIFAGYEKYAVDYLENRLRSCFPRWLRESLFPTLSRLAYRINLSPFRRAGSLLHSLSHDPAMGFYLSNSQISDRTWRQLLRPEIARRLGDYHPSRITTDAYHAADGPDHLSRILYTDLKTYLPGGILVKVDRMSMANSLEVRAPLLDREVVEFMAGVPSDLKFHSGDKKHLLKKAFRKLLPETILTRRKMGFSVPLASWMRGEIRDLAEERLLHRDGGLVDLFRPEAIASLWHEHQSERRDHANVLWSMLIYQMWWDRYASAEKNA